MSCKHLNFEAEVAVNRLSKEEGGPITHYCADIKIRCAECKMDFEFVGVSAGYNPLKPMADATFTTLNVPICENKGSIAAKLSYTVNPPDINKSEIN